jgi:inhibitor of KinA
MDNPTVRKYSASAILVEWESEISPEIHDQVVGTTKFLNENHSDWILEIVPSYHSLVIYLKKNADLNRCISLCQSLEIPSSHAFESKKTWLVPTCYDSSFGYDLEDISHSSKLSSETIIKLHSEAKYRIYGMGFLPGFLYLGGLSEQIHTPRKGVIKQLVPKGSVAIGGKQTGIYPQKSPGGWNVIGRTPIELFNPKLQNPSPFSIGDSIQFVPIDLIEYDEILSEVKGGNYELKYSSND